jgi:ketopantoate reductase
MSMCIIYTASQPFSIFCIRYNAIFNSDAYLRRGGRGLSHLAALPAPTLQVPWQRVLDEFADPAPPDASYTEQLAVNRYRDLRTLGDDKLRNSNAGFDARLVSDIKREMWEKWILLAGLGGINCLMRGTIGEVAQAPRGSEFVARLLQEIVAVVEAVGVGPSPEFMVAAKTGLAAPGSTQTSSMYRDLLRGVPIEADQIIGDLLGRARAAGIETPLLGAIWTHLCVYQRRALA